MSHPEHGPGTVFLADLRSGLMNKSLITIRELTCPLLVDRAGGFAMKKRILALAVSLLALSSVGAEPDEAQIKKGLVDT